MPEQLEHVCERCGQPNEWSGRTLANVCAECLNEEAEVSAEYDREEAALRDLEDNAA